MNTPSTETPKPAPVTLMLPKLPETALLVAIGNMKTPFVFEAVLGIVPDGTNQKTENYNRKPLVVVLDEGSEEEGEKRLANRVKNCDSKDFVGMKFSLVEDGRILPKGMALLIVWENVIPQLAWNEETEEMVEQPYQVQTADDMEKLFKGFLGLILSTLLESWDASGKSIFDNERVTKDERQTIGGAYKDLLTALLRAGALPPPIPATAPAVAIAA
jgi:hypothetical protein